MKILDSYKQSTNIYDTIDISLFRLQQLLLIYLLSQLTSLGSQLRTIPTFGFRTDPFKHRSILESVGNDNESDL